MILAFATGSGKTTAVVEVLGLLRYGAKPTVRDVAAVQQAWDDADSAVMLATNGTASLKERQQAARQAAHREALAILARRKNRRG